MLCLCLASHCLNTCHNLSGLINSRLAWCRAGRLGGALDQNCLPCGSTSLSLALHAFWSLAPQSSANGQQTASGNLIDDWLLCRQQFLPLHNNVRRPLLTLTLFAQHDSSLTVVGSPGQASMVVSMDMRHPNTSQAAHHLPHTLMPKSATQLPQCPLPTVQ